MRLTATRCPPISPINTIITFRSPQEGHAQVVSTCFADTSFWIGLSSKRGQHHQRAVAWYQFAIRTGSTIVTTEAVLLEWLNALSGVSTRRIAAGLSFLVMERRGLDEALTTDHDFEQAGLKAMMRSLPSL